MKILNLINTLILFLLVALSSCSKDEIVQEVNVENQLNININGVQYKSINDKIGGNENCDKLFISASYFDENKIDFTVRFQISKSGQLLKVWYEEYVLPNPAMLQKSIFLTPNFRPLSTFAISNFVYNEATGETNFDFTGKVFLENNSKVERTISGAIKIKSLRTTTCSAVNTGIRFNSEDLNLYSFSEVRTLFPNQTQQHKFFSNNGYRLYINTKTDLWNYPLGNLVFDENDNIDNVEFAKAIGPIFADQIQNFDLQKWQQYQTSGQIIILNKTIENNQKVITGKINLIVKENNQIIFLLKGINFKTGSFLN